MSDLYDAEDPIREECQDGYYDPEEYVKLERHQRNFGEEGPLAYDLIPHFKSSPKEPFSGSAVQGTRVSDAPMSTLQWGYLAYEAYYAKDKYGKNWSAYTTYPTSLHLNHKGPLPGFETLYDFSNPIKEPLITYLQNLPPGDREKQAKVLFGQHIQTEIPEGYYSRDLPTRIQVVRAAAEAYQLEPELVAAIILTEQRDQSLNEDAADFQSNDWLGHNSSIGLGQVAVNTAEKHDLFSDVIGDKTKSFNTNLLLASDEFNIFATAKYLRIVADMGGKLANGGPYAPSYKFFLPGYPPIRTKDLAVLLEHSSKWPTNAYIALIGSEYTSEPFDQRHLYSYGIAVVEAYNDVKKAGIF